MKWVRAAATCQASRPIRETLPSGEKHQRRSFHVPVLAHVVHPARSKHAPHFAMDRIPLTNSPLRHLAKSADRSAQLRHPSSICESGSCTVLFLVTMNTVAVKCGP